MLTILQGNGNAPHRRQRRPSTSAAAGARIVGLEARTAWDARAPAPSKSPPAASRNERSTRAGHCPALRQGIETGVDLNEKKPAPGFPDAGLGPPGP